MMLRSSRLTRRSFAAALPLGLALGAGAMAAPAHAAQAQPMASVECASSLGSITVDANLVVPSGETCQLEGTTVAGDVTVRSGANLAANGALLGNEDSTLRVNRNGYADLVRTNVGGEVRLASAYGLYSERSSFDGQVTARKTGFVYLYDSSMDAGATASRDTALMAEFVDVDGAIRGRNSAYVDVYDSTVDGTVRISDTTQGTFFCSTHTEGNVRLLDNGGDVVVGGTGEVGTGCGGNMIEGNLRLTDNAGDILVQNNVVGGNLVCRYNETAPTGEGNIVRGRNSGQCADMQAPAAANSTLKAQADDRREQHRAEIQELAQQRLG